MEENDLRICGGCGRKVQRSEMSFTYDCHGITCRLLCGDCWEEAMANGYDGEYYDEYDECLDEEEGW